MPVEAVVFDIGNVLIEWNPERFFDARLGAERRRQLFSEVPLLAMNDEVDRGVDFAASVSALAADHPGWAEDIACWHDNWIEMASPAIDRSVRLLRALRARGVPVFALSNFGRATFDIACAHYPFLTEFDQRYISGHIGAIKPEPRIYELLESTCGVAPAGLLFVDDRADNIAMAQSRGWQVHHFEGAEGWADRLVAEGLLEKEEAE
ncbi:MULTISPECIES: HAD family hydrolase [Marinovum]|uniref:HAD family hydrolase n=1 Tax=Marinovum TaxID=367771 RepID=UPI00065B0B0C|nr:MULTISPECIES: HAD family phosphatase [Marinovum]AKO95547.1 haloacid dehalogenase superfamily, subfamily IA, variant 3 with third motif protein having DD or ED [Marinovum algicola DG 898]MDD9743791.1 HAD family phosphatase [Marinovum sp. PR37]